MRPEARQLEPGFPDLSLDPRAAELLSRWQTLLARAPRLRPWLAQMLQRRRVTGVVEGQLWADLARWLSEFESLPHFTLSAIATTVHEDAPEPRAAKDEQQDAPEQPGQGDSPERTVGELEMLVQDPAFALAFHCVEARVRPALWPLVPESSWFGLLHASSRVQPRLTPEVAVALVLKARSAQWQAEPLRARTAALRLFHARPGDAGPASLALCAEVPRSWQWSEAQAALPEFVAASARARAALEDASQLCGRLVAKAVRSRGLAGRLGGLALLEETSAVPATREELAELARSAMRHGRMAGFRALLCIG